MSKKSKCSLICFEGKKEREKFNEVKVSEKSLSGSIKERYENCVKEFKPFFEENQKFFKKRSYVTDSGQIVNFDEYFEKDFERKILQFEDNSLLIESGNVGEITEKSTNHFDNIKNYYLKTKAEKDKRIKKNNSITCFSFFSSSKKEVKLPSEEEKKNNSLNNNDNIKEMINDPVNNYNSNKQPELVNIKFKEFISPNSQFEYFEITFSVCIDFYLTTDPLIAFLKYRKEGLNPVIHLISNEINEDSYIRDVNYIDLHLRSNFLHILNSAGKQIKYPIIYNGNTYFQYLFFMRNSNFKLLNNPLNTPGLLVQLFPDDTDQQDKINTSNSQIVWEALEISDMFNHDSVIVNLLKFNDAWFLIKTILTYIENFSKKSYCVVKNLIFMTDLNFDSFCTILQHPRINDAFEKYRLKYRVFSD